MRIALFGGNFDPLHKGHLKVAQTVIDTLPIDQVWFVPAGKHPQKENTFFSFEQRIELIKDAIKGNPKFSVYEDDLPPSMREGGVGVTTDRSYTLHLIKDLKRLYPNYQFSFIIGADNVTKLQTWYKYEELLEQIDFIVINRETDDKAGWHTLSYYHKLRFVDMPPVNISSTEIREQYLNSGSI